MAAAIVSGIFALVLAGVSWLVSNGGKQGRILTRIERMTAVLKEMPDDLDARTALTTALQSETVALMALSLPTPPDFARLDRLTKAVRASLYVLTAAATASAAVATYAALH